jgi:hypothetical protein
MDEADAREARSAARGKLRLLRPIAGAAAAIAVVMGGATIFSYNAEPGDPLWSVKSVVFSQQADSTVAQIDTTSQLQEAERMLATGDAESVKNLLDNAADRAGGIRDADQRRELEVWRAKLAAQLAEIAPTTTAQARTRYDHDGRARSDHSATDVAARTAGHHVAGRRTAARNYSAEHRPPVAGTPPDSVAAVASTAADRASAALHGRSDDHVGSHTADGRSPDL